MSANTIPDDVMRAARAIMAASLVEFGGGLEGGAVLRCIIDAILAERQRCAAICDDYCAVNDKASKSPGWDSACLGIQNAILVPPSAASSRAEQNGEAEPPLASSPVPNEEAQ